MKDWKIFAAGAFALYFYIALIGNISDSKEEILSQIEMNHKEVMMEIKLTFCAE